MSTFNTTALYFCDTDAEYRTLIGHIRSALALGWTQAADTGQINPATVTYPGGNNSDSGYEIWYLNDALHATFPIYMKITYGRGGAAGALRLTFSFSMHGTNGAGTLLNGSDTATFTWSGSPSTRLVSDATLYRIYASGGAGRTGIVWCPDVNAAPWGSLFVIERFRDADGTMNGSGFWCWVTQFRGTNNVNTTAGLTFVYNAMFTQSWHTRNVDSRIWVCAFADHDRVGSTERAARDDASSLMNGKVNAYPVFPLSPMAKGPVTQILPVLIQDFPTDFSNVNVDIIGATSVYKPMGVYANDPLNHSDANCKVGILLRYE